MTVRTIQEINKSRVKVILDNGFAFVIYKGELYSYKIKEGEELKEETYDEIMHTVLPKRAKLRAMNLLKVRPYTFKGLRDKLTEGGYPEEIIDIAIDYVASFHYLDDLQYARDYIYTYKERKNKQKLIQDLINKGVSKDLIEEAFESELSTDETDYEGLQIKNILRKKGYYDREFSYEELQKLKASLYRKGFSSDKISEYLT